MRELGYDSSRHFGLDAVLLIVGQIGLVAYKIFTFIACSFTTDYGEDSILVLLGAVAAILQVGIALNKQLLGYRTVTATFKCRQ